jgi:hypothetical protein
VDSDQFEQNAQALVSMIQERREHLAAGRCNDPGCIGPAATLALRNAVAVDPGWPSVLVLVAVAMLADDRERIEKLEAALEIQRKMTADSAAAAMGLDADLVDAHGRIAGLERSLASALAELTLWEESSDVIGPVLPVAES